MTWRVHLQDYIFSCGLRDVYQFGVYSGESMADIQNIYNFKKIPIRNFYGFDSFEGLPEEKNEPIAQECWKKGGFDAREKFQVKTINECMNKVVDKINTDSFIQENEAVILVPGFFCDVLTDELVKQYTMQPAAFVDLDADIYTSTYEALDFMCRNKLIVPGTFLAYDDWGGTPGWKTYSDGESRAHKEICEKYKLECNQLVQFGGEFPHVQTLFIVEEIE